MRRLSLSQARRFAVAAQGLAAPRPAGRIDVRHFRRVIRSTGLLQLDSVNVLVRSHYLPVFSRLGPYDRADLDRWTSGSGEMYEYWGHQASLLPIETYPALRFRMAQTQPGSRIQRLWEERPGYVESVLEQVEDRGPVTSAELDDPGERTGPWWGYPPGKIALEWLFATGRVAAYRNGTFARLYDAPDRVLPTATLEEPALREGAAYRDLLLRAARHHAVGTAADLADYHKLHMPTARTVLASLASEGQLEEVEVPGWKGPVYLHPEAILPRRPTGTALLSPFDSLVWGRDRIERLFGFRYRIEIYVPEPQRRHGYYVLPFLLDGDLVARVDLKADRKERKLLVRSAHVEPDMDRLHVARALGVELNALARWLVLEEVAVQRRGDLAADLGRFAG